MMDSEKFRNDPTRLLLLQKLINLHDNAVISHKLDENQNIVAVYDKYSTIRIQKLKSALLSYEYRTYGKSTVEGSGFIRINGKAIYNDLQVCSEFKSDENDLIELQVKLKEAVKNEDYEECERLKNLIEKLKK